MMSTLYVLLSCVAVCLAQQVVDHPVVQTTSGPIQGETIEYPAGRLARYLGVPFARPPLGSLRFTPPQNPDPWTETLTTTAYPNRCYQNTFMDGRISLVSEYPEISEDCLYLNVHVPVTEGKEDKSGPPSPLPPTAPPLLAYGLLGYPDGMSDIEKGLLLPNWLITFPSSMNSSGEIAVMVWIHGGGLIGGAGSEYPLEALSVAGNVITISFNYRLDVFGFMATGDDRAQGNAGFLDQVFVLRWIQDNIAAFGGDPGKVTIFGESAGGWSVSALMVSPLTRGLFARAISQSGSLYGYTLDTREERAEKTRSLATDLDCPATPEAEMLTCLQNVDTDKLFKAAAVKQYMAASASGATAGGEFLPGQPGALWDEHRLTPGVDYMLGVNSEEGALCLWFDPSAAAEYIHNGVTPEDPFYARLIDSIARLPSSQSHLTELIKECVKDQYIPDLADKFGVFRGLLDGLADKVFIAPTLGTAARMADTDQKVYLYYFDHPLTSKLDITIPFLKSGPDFELGPDHGKDVLYMMAWPFVEGVPNSWVVNTTDQDKAISRSMVHAWTTFAKTGEMKVLLDDGSEMEWPEYEKPSERYLEWKYPMTSSSVKSRLRPRANSFWNVLIPALLEKELKPDNSQPTSQKDEL